MVLEPDRTGCIAQVKAKTLQFEETIAKLQAQVAKLVKEKADLQIRCSVLEGLTDAQDAHLDRIRKDKVCSLALAVSVPW